MNTPHLRINDLEMKMNTPVWRGMAQTGVFNSIKVNVISQIDCLICLPDRSGDFFAFKAKIARNNGKSEKTGFRLVDQTNLKLVFCVFKEKIPRTFWDKYTEQSTREKVAGEGFEPRNN